MNLKISLMLLLATVAANPAWAGTHSHHSLKTSAPRSKTMQSIKGSQYSRKHPDKPIKSQPITLQNLTPNTLQQLPIGSQRGDGRVAIAPSYPITIVGNGAGTTKGFHPPLGTIKPITNTAVMTGGTTTSGSSPSRPDYIWAGDHWVRSTSGQIYTPIPVRDHRGEGNPDRGGGVTVTPVPGKQRTNDVVGVGGSPIDEVINYFFTGFPHGSLDTAGTTRDHRSSH